MSRARKIPFLSVPCGYRQLKRRGIKTLPGDLRQSLNFKPPYFWTPVWDAEILTSLDYENGIYVRPINRKAQRKDARCTHCHRTKERVGSGCRYESYERHIHLTEVGTRLVCSRCISETKRAVSRHYNLVLRLGGLPTYEGAPLTVDQAKARHVKAVLA